MSIFQGLKKPSKVNTSEYIRTEDKPKETTDKPAEKPVPSTETK